MNKKNQSQQILPKNQNTTHNLQSKPFCLRIHYIYISQ